MEPNLIVTNSAADVERCCYLLGNSPGLRCLSNDKFSAIPTGITTFGSGAAYKFYERINW